MSSTTEIEAKFLNINLDELRSKLSVAGAKQLMPMMSLRRAILETPEMRSKSAFVRIRDEGDKITAVYKQHAKLELGGATEISLIVDNFEIAVDLFRAAGIGYKSYQETKRETWQLDDAIITLDVWPWLEPLVEIEADNEDAVRTVATTLGFDWNEAVFGGIMVAYQHKYPNINPKASIIDLAEVKFDTPLPEMFKA
jgi:adenylate cyclase class 2